MMDSKLHMNEWDESTFRKPVHAYSHLDCQIKEAALVTLIQGYNICKKLQCNHRH